MRSIVIFMFILILGLTTSATAGDIVFASAAAVAVGTGPRGICTGDFNGDGKADLATVNVTTDDVSVLIGIGNGTFQPAVSYPAGTDPSGVCAADVNDDGDIDLAVSNFISDDISIFLGKGDGTFEAAVNYTVGVDGNGPRAIVAAELNGTGLIDLAVANEWGDSVAVLINNDDGTFLAPVLYSVGVAAVPMAIFSADFDGLNGNDLVVANSGPDSSNVAVLLNTGGGTFAAPVTYATDLSPRSVSSADLDGNGSFDLAVVNTTNHKWSALLNEGGGTFAAAVTYPAGSTPRAIDIVDLDGDTFADVVVANAVSNNVSIYINQGDGSFDPAVVYAVGTEPTAICSADFDGDTDNDLATANFVDNTVSILLNGTDILVDVGDDTHSTGLPTGARLRQNYPNPFNPETVIEFSLPHRSFVSVTVYNVLGQQVRQLVSNELAAGDHAVSWDGCDDGGETVAGGFYLYRLQTDESVQNRKMLLLK